MALIRLFWSAHNILSISSFAAVVTVSHSGLGYWWSEREGGREVEGEGGGGKRREKEGREGRGNIWYNWVSTTT